jgi:hypothetical protein
MKRSEMANILNAEKEERSDPLKNEVRERSEGGAPCISLH